MNLNIAPPLEDDNMEVEMERNQDEIHILQPSPPRTPTPRLAQPVTEFLSPIQRELNRPGTSLTQRTAGILNSEVFAEPISCYV